MHHLTLLKARSLKWVRWAASSSRSCEGIYFLAHSVFFLFFKFFIYFFVCDWAGSSLLCAGFLSCRERRLLSRCGLLTAVASLLAEHGLQQLSCTDLVTPRHVGSSQARNGTRLTFAFLVTSSSWLWPSCIPLRGTQILLWVYLNNQG